MKDCGGEWADRYDPKDSKVSRYPAVAQFFQRAGEERIHLKVRSPRTIKKINWE